MPSAPYWFTWRKEQKSETCFTFGASSLPRRLVRFLFCFLSRIKQIWWPCLSHLPLRLALLLASLTHLLCICYPFSTILSLFSYFLHAVSSLFNEQLLTCKSPVLRQIWLDRIIFRCSSQHKSSDILRENPLRSPNKNQGVQRMIM